MFQKSEKPKYEPTTEYLKYLESIKPISVPMGYRLVDDSYVPQRDFLDYKKRLSLFYRLKNAGIDTQVMQTYEPTDYLGSKSKDNIPRLQKFLEVFPQVKDVVLYFYGGNSTQKTTIASWIGREIIKQKYSVKFVLMNTLIKKLTAFSTDEQRIANIDEYKKCDWLIIDEAFDKEKITLYKSGYQIPFIDSFIRERLTDGKGILFASNVPYTQIEEQGFSKSVSALIKRSILSMDTYFEWKDNFFEAEQGFDSRRGLF